ncbi:MAG: mechanosensitive ion channel family protein [Ruminococcaceae bacterium]|nr:mechanosensitive ion channel family protein [Oscillospiraceae bacterium]
MDWNKIGGFLSDLLISLGFRLVAALLLLVVGLRLISWFKKFLKKSPKLDKMDVSVRTFLVSFSSIALYILLVITIASVLGVPATSFITIIASCGVAIGLALQGALSNFAGGIMILLFKPFQVGDYIEASGESGTVEAISVVYTELLTPDNKRVTIPNGTLTNAVIENYTAEKTRRVDLTFNTAYENDVEEVKTLIAQVVAAHPLVLSDPAPIIRLSAHGESALTYDTKVWCKTEDYWAVKFDLTEQVKAAFDRAEVKIPYNQLDVHVKQGE